MLEPLEAAGSRGEEALGPESQGPEPDTASLPEQSPQSDALESSPGIFRTFTARAPDRCGGHTHLPGALLSWESDGSLCDDMGQRPPLPAPTVAVVYTQGLG